MLVTDSSVLLFGDSSGVWSVKTLALTVPNSLMLFHVSIY